MCLLIDITPNPYQAFSNIVSFWEERKALTKVWVGVEEMRKDRELREEKVREDSEPRDLLQRDGCSNSKNTHTHTHTHTHTRQRKEGLV